MSVHEYRPPSFGDRKESEHETGGDRWWRLFLYFKGPTIDGLVEVYREGRIRVFWTYRDGRWVVYRIERMSDGKRIYPREGAE